MIKHVWAVFICVFVVTAVLGVALVHYIRPNTQSGAEGSYHEVMLQTAELDRQGRHYDEEQLLKKYLQTNPPQTYRYLGLMNLGNLAYETRDDFGAMGYYQEAVAANDGKLTEFTAETMGEAAAAAGNKAMAIEYFKKAIQLTVVKQGVGNDLDDLNATVKHLEGTQ